jgi:putative addiction module component (TIGR02574 family)
MSAAAERVERAIRKLPITDMIELHESLIDSIHEAQAELGLSPEWKQELGRRLSEIRSGRVKGIPVERTYRKIKRKYS